MKWIPRARPKIDRIACPWLVDRFVDPQAEFFYADTSRLDLTPQAAGLYAVSLGRSQKPCR